MKKLLLISVFLTAFGVVGWQVYEKVTASVSSGPRKFRSMAVAVEIEPVRTATMRDVGKFSGTLYPRSQFVVASKIPGRLEKILVNIGDPVKRGQLIAVIENDEYQQQVEQSLAALQVALANLEESKSSLATSFKELERMKTLRRKQIVAESELDTASARYKTYEVKNKVAEAKLIQQEAALKAAQIRLSYTQIRASWEGGDDARVIGERFVNESDLLAPNKSIVSVLDIDSLTAVINVIEQDYSKITVGQEATLYIDAFPGESFTGKVIRIAPLLNEKSRQGRVEVEVPNTKNRLRPGMFINVSLEFLRHDNAVVVPVAALVNRKGRQGVFIADINAGKVKFVPVTIGISDNELAEVVAPPISGSVVTLGQHLLQDGSAFILPDEEKSPKKGTANKRNGPDGGSPGSGGRS
jgi:RND family efflux transporter MFP subunit